MSEGAVKLFFGPFCGSERGLVQSPNVEPEDFKVKPFNAGHQILSPVCCRDFLIGSHLPDSSSSNHLTWCSYSDASLSDFKPARVAFCSLHTGLNASTLSVSTQAA